MQLLQNIKTEIDDVKILQVIQRQQRSSFGIIRDPPILDFDPQQKLSFQIWKEKWESWLYMAIQRGGLDRNQIYHSLKNCFTDRTMGYFLSLRLNETAENNPELIIQSLSALVTSAKNRNYFRNAFQSRVQKSGEKFDTWLADLKELMRSADYDQECGGKCKDDRLLQQIIAGVFKAETRQMLLDVGSGLSLEQAARVVKTTEFGSDNRVEGLDNYRIDQVEHHPTQAQESYNVVQTRENRPTLPQENYSHIQAQGDCNRTLPTDTHNDSLGFLNPSYLSTPPSWPKSFEVNQYAIQTEIIASKPRPSANKKRKLDLEKGYISAVLPTETLTQPPAKRISNKTSNQLVLSNIRSLNSKPIPKQTSQNVPVKMVQTVLQVPKQVFQNTQETFQKPQPVSQNPTTTPKPVKARNSKHRTPNGNVSNVFLSTNSFTSTSYDVTNNSSQPGGPNNFYCKQCDKTFTMFFALKKHHCAAKTSDNSRLCSNCQEPTNAIDKKGRCDPCRESALNNAKDIAATPKTVPNVKYEVSNFPAIVNPMILTINEPPEKVSSPQEQVISPFVNTPCDKMPCESSDPFVKAQQPLQQASKISPSEEQLEQMILEAIEILRKKGRVSSDIKIAKHVIAQNRSITFDMVLTQMSKCITFGLIEKLNRKNSQSYRLVAPIRPRS